jgi:hypothetical protein
LAKLLANLDGVIHYIKDHFQIVAQYETAKTVNITESIHKLYEINVILMETQYMASLNTHNLGVLAKQLETVVDTITSISSTANPSVQRTHSPNSADIKPTFKCLKPKELDRLGFDLAALRQLTHDDLVAKEAVSDAQATSLATYACYLSTFLHAEKFERALEHATITLNLRQGQANSPDIADFATKIVHDPTDYTFLGSTSTIMKERTSPACHKNSPPPSPPSAPKPPPPCPMPVSRVKPYGIKRTKVAVPYINTPLCVPPHNPLSTPGYYQQKK